MEFNEVENLSDEQISELYSDVFERGDIVASRIPTEYTVYYSIGCSGTSYTPPGGNGCFYRTTFVYQGSCFCDYSCVYAIGPVYVCPDGGGSYGGAK